MFTQTSGGEYRLQEKYQNTFRFSEEMGKFFGNNATEFANVFRTHGGGVNSQALLEPDTKIIAALMNRDVSTGRAGYQRVQELRNSAHMSEARLQAGANLTNEEGLTRLSDENNRHINALLENTKALEISRQQEEFQASNPGTSAFVRALPFGETMESVTHFKRNTERGLDQWLGIDQETQANLTQRGTAGAARMIGEQATNVNPINWLSEKLGLVLGNAIGPAIRDAFRDNPVRATMEPVAARQATTEAVSQRNRQPPP
jgi:hypothetical protein